MAEVILNDKNFEDEVFHSDKPVLVDFWATWCGPCQMLSPIIAEIAEEYGDKVKVCKVNVDDEPILATKFNIVSIPTLILFKDGHAVNTTVGYQSKEQVLNFLEI